MTDAGETGAPGAAIQPKRLPQAAAFIFALGMAHLPMNEAAAEVTSAASSGFEVREQVHVAAAPATVYAALITPSRWWDSEHTYSGNAANLTLDAKAGGCWCEAWADGGSAVHMMVVYVAPGKTLRLRGALGPLQAMGTDGAMTLHVQSAGNGTDLTVTYAVGGYSKDGFETLSKSVDHVLGEQVARLQKLAETGSAGGAKR
jgi:uncharacterized protein YndB with AHSA1/START domain